MAQPTKGPDGTASSLVRDVKASAPTLALEPFVVKPAVAWKLLSCGNTKGYELLAAGELDSFLDGGSRKITLASIHRYIERRLAQGSSLRSNNQK